MKFNNFLPQDAIYDVASYIYGALNKEINKAIRNYSGGIEYYFASKYGWEVLSQSNLRKNYLSTHTIIAGVPLNNTGVCYGLTILYAKHKLNPNNISFIKELNNKINNPEQNKDFFKDLFFYQECQRNYYYLFPPKNPNQIIRKQYQEKDSFIINDLNNYSINELLTRAGICNVTTNPTVVRIDLAKPTGTTWHSVAFSFVINNNLINYEFYEPNIGLCKNLTEAEFKTKLINLFKFQGYEKLYFTDINSEIADFENYGLSHLELVSPGDKIETDFILQNQLIPLNGISPEGSTPLITSILYSKSSTALQLLVLGADPNIPFSAKPKFVPSLRHYCTKHISDENNCDLINASQEEWTPLEIAAHLEDSQMIFALIKYGANIHQNTSGNMTVLQRIAAKNPKLGQELTYYDSIKNITPKEAWAGIINEIWQYKYSYLGVAAAVSIPVALSLSGYFGSILLPLATTIIAIGAGASLMAGDNTNVNIVSLLNKFLMTIEFDKKVRSLS